LAGAAQAGAQFVGQQAAGAALVLQQTVLP
jgi:hypothetical protein